MSVSDLKLIDTERLISLEGFESVYCVDSTGVQVVVNRFAPLRFEYIDSCVTVDDDDDIDSYVYRIYTPLNSDGYFELKSVQRNVNFEKQFPFFPYDRTNHINKTLDKKLNRLEQQNIALLSHLETIMIALKLRSAADDNLDFTLPK